MSDTYSQQHKHYGSDSAYLGCLKAERRQGLRRSDRTEAAAQLAEMALDADEAQHFYLFGTELDDESRFIWELDEYPPTAGCSWDNVDFCHVCSRVTNHVAEHDDLVALGMARYEDGDVILTDPTNPLPRTGWNNLAHAA